MRCRCVDCCVCCQKAVSLYAGRIVVKVDGRAVDNAESAAVLIASAAALGVHLVKVCETLLALSAAACSLEA